LQSSNSLSQILNAGVNSLETRKTRARNTLNLFDDIVQLRGSLNHIQDCLADDRSEDATYFMAKAMALIKVLSDAKHNVIKENDREIYEGVRKQLSSNLRDKMLTAIAKK
jgi:hypothetical protein